MRIIIQLLIQIMAANQMFNFPQVVISPAKQVTNNYKDDLEDDFDIDEVQDRMEALEEVFEELKQGSNITSLYKIV